MKRMMIVWLIVMLYCVTMTMKDHGMCVLTMVMMRLIVHM